MFNIKTYTVVFGLTVFPDRGVNIFPFEKMLRNLSQIENKIESVKPVLWYGSKNYRTLPIS